MDLLLLLIVLLILFGAVPVYRRGGVDLPGLLITLVVIVILLALVGAFLPFPRRVWY